MCSMWMRRCWRRGVGLNLAKDKRLFVFAVTGPIMERGRVRATGDGRYVRVSFFVRCGGSAAGFVGIARAVWARFSNASNLIESRYQGITRHG